MITEDKTAPSSPDHDRCKGTPEMLALIPQLTYRKLDHWTRTGRLTAHTHHLERNGGSGVPLYWAPNEVATTERVVQLLNCGFNLDAAVDMARNPHRIAATTQTLTAMLTEVAA